jgi:hypothetical protein
MGSVNPEPQAVHTSPEITAPQVEEPEPYFGDRIALYLLVGGFFVLAALIFADSLLRLIR